MGMEDLSTTRPNMRKLELKAAELRLAALETALSGGKGHLNKPDYGVQIAPSAGVLTIGTLEQIGRNFGPFLDFLLEKKPRICVHVETLYEVYDQDNLVDWLAAAYLEKRNYLRGFLARMRELEAEGRVRILDLRRTFGSFYHDGYTYLVWEPL